MAGIETDEAAGRGLDLPLTVESKSSIQNIIDKITIANGYHRSEGNYDGQNGAGNPSITFLRINGQQPGFRPLETINSDTNISPNGWYGNLFDIHKNKIALNISQRFDESNDDKTAIVSKRDGMLKFNDTSSDYLLHGVQIANKPLGENGTTYKDKNTPFENNDPVIFGFDVVIDSVNSPLLNGSIEDFIAQFSVISEIQSRATVITEFKQQFSKLFKTNASIPLINPTQNSIIDNNSGLSKYANAETPKGKLRPGKKAYMSYYIQSISGLSKLAESNTSSAKKYLAEYRKDLITLSFLEDVSATMGTLSHLYKLLYWSKANGKGLIPENLLRFNCEIIVSECRNFIRVREALDSGNLEIIKDNVSRYVYSLKECQLFFDKMPHDDTIDMGAIKPFDKYDVSFDYKYSTLKFERWVSDNARFGNYIGYNDGSIWRKSSTLGTEAPKFYTKGKNSFNQQGVKNAEILKTVGAYNETKQEITNSIIASTQSTPPGITQIKEDSKAKGLANVLAKKAANFAISEVNNQIKIRKRIFNDTINKIRDISGMSGIKTEPKRIYPKPYTPHSFGIFFDVRNSLYNFIGEELSSILQNGVNVIDPTKDPSNPRKNPFASAKAQGIGIFKNNTNSVANTLGSIKGSLSNTSKRFRKK